MKHLGRKKWSPGHHFFIFYHSFILSQHFFLYKRLFFRSSKNVEKAKIKVKSKDKINNKGALTQCANPSTYRSGARGGCSSARWMQSLPPYCSKEKNGYGLAISSFFIIHSFFHVYHLFLPCTTPMNKQTQINIHINTNIQKPTETKPRPRKKDAAKI